MTKSKFRTQFRATMLSRLDGDNHTVATRILRKLEDLQGRLSTLGEFHGKDRDTLIVFKENEVVAGVVIHTLPAIDIIIAPGSPIECARIIQFAHTRAEGVLNGIGAQEYLGVVPICEENPMWREKVRERFDGELFDAELYEVFRRAL